MSVSRRLAPACCRNRLNATAAQPGNGARHREPPQAAPKIATVASGWHRFGASMPIETVQVLGQTEIVTMRPGWPGCAGISPDRAVFLRQPDVLRQWAQRLEIDPAAPAAKGADDAAARSES